MKNLLTIITAIAFLAIFSSCKKDYVCSCEILGVSTATTLMDVTKSDAEDMCAQAETDAEAEAAAGGITLEVTCSLN